MGEARHLVGELARRGLGNLNIIHYLCKLYTEAVGFTFYCVQRVVLPWLGFKPAILRL